MDFSGIPNLTEMAKKHAQDKYDFLKGMGLPEPQCAKSARAELMRGRMSPSDAPGPTESCTVYALLKYHHKMDMAEKMGGKEPEFCTLEELTEEEKKELSSHFALYASTSRSMPGKIHASYTMDKDGLSFHEVFDSENALDIHIANCFEHYAMMMPMCHMAEARAACDASKVDQMKPLMTAWCADAEVNARM